MLAGLRSRWHDAVFVRGFERVARSAERFERPRGRLRICLTRAMSASASARPFDEFHHQRGRATALLDAVYRRDIADDSATASVRASRSKRARRSLSDGDRIGQ